MQVIESQDGYFERCRWLVTKALSVNGPIIDIGCADAFMFRDIAKDKTTFVDNSPEAQKRCEGLNFHLADAHNLPFPNNSFDVAVLGEVLEHVQDPAQVLREAVRVSRKKLVITVPLEYEWALDAKPFTTLGHIRFYTEPILRQHLAEAGITQYKMFKIRGGAWVFLAVEIDKTS